MLRPMCACRAFAPATCTASTARCTPEHDTAGRPTTNVHLPLACALLVAAAGAASAAGTFPHPASTHETQAAGTSGCQQCLDAVALAGYHFALWAAACKLGTAAAGFWSVAGCLVLSQNQVQVFT